MHAVNIFKGTDSSVIGRKFPGSSDGPFLCMSILADFFHSSVIIPGFPYHRYKILNTDIFRGGDPAHERQT